MPHSAMRLCSSTWRSLSGAMTESLVNGGVVLSSWLRSDSARASRSRLRASRRSTLTGAGAVIAIAASLGSDDREGPIRLSSLRGVTQSQAALARPREDLAVRVRDLAAKQRDRRPARDLPSLVGVVVARGVHLARTDRARALRIEDHDVGIVAYRDLALAAQTSEARRRRGEHVDHALDTEPAAAHP